MCFELDLAFLAGGVLLAGAAMWLALQSSPVLILYHAANANTACFDGSLSVALVMQSLGWADRRSVTAVPVFHSGPQGVDRQCVDALLCRPETRPGTPAGLAEMSSLCSDIQLIDHHETGGFSKFSGCVKPGWVFDASCAACMLVARQVGGESHGLVRLVDKGDRFAFQGDDASESRYFCLTVRYGSTTPADAVGLFRSWLAMDSEDWESMIGQDLETHGRAMMQRATDIVDRYLDVLHVPYSGGKRVVVFDMTLLPQLADMHKFPGTMRPSFCAKVLYNRAGVDFVVGLGASNRAAGKRSVTFFCDPDASGLDMGAVASAFGGGGSAGCAGASLDFAKIDSLFLFAK